MPAVVYLVIGECGEFDDFSSWIVTGYLKRESAEARARSAEAFAVAERWRRRSTGYDHQPAENPYDPSCPLDGSYEVAYKIDSVLLEDSDD